MKRLLTILAIALLPACAVLGPEDPAPIVVKPAAARPIPRMPKKQFGALWSEDSTWNDIYSASAGRQIGDIVVVKLDEVTKHAIVERYDQILPPVVEEVVPPTAEEEAKTPAQKQKEAMVAKAEKLKESQVPKTVRAFIREIRPRGMYVIAGQETVRFGPRTPRVAIEGTIRDRDIDSTDSILIDQLLNPRMDVSLTPEQSKETPRTAELGEVTSSITGG